MSLISYIIPITVTVAFVLPVRIFWRWKKPFLEP